MNFMKDHMCFGNADNSPQIRQIGIVVRDINRSVAYMKEFFGLKPVGYAETPNSENKTYFGNPEDYMCKMAFYRFGDMDVELISHVRGRSVWKDFLDSHGEGLHHIQLWVKHFDTAKNYLEAHGIPMVQSGESFRYPGAKFGYFDAVDQLGFYLELFNPEECGYGR